MPSDLNPEQEALKSLEALPVASKFNIRFVGEGRFSDELYGYHQDGEITIGDQVYGFSNVSTPESLQDSDYESSARLDTLSFERYSVW